MATKPKSPSAAGAAAATSMKMDTMKMGHMEMMMPSVPMAPLRFDQEFQTFANHLSMNSAAVRATLNFPWKDLFPLTYPRKDQSTLTANEHERFLCAFNVLNQNGVLGQFVETHGQSIHQMHHTLRFLPWHRIYLVKFEQALRSIHPDVCIPYWDWTKAAEQTFPAWLAGATPTVVTPSRTIHVVRAPGTPAAIASYASGVPGVLGQNAFTNFWNGIEAIHDAIHVWVGGTMGAIPTAPADPIFWMHHANIDRLWSVWQKSPQGTGKFPPLSGAAAIMDPYPESEPATRDTTTLGYTYA